MPAVTVCIIRLGGGKTQAFVGNRTGKHAGDVVRTKGERVTSQEFGQVDRDLMIVGRLRCLLDDFAPPH